MVMGRSGERGYVLRVSVVADMGWYGVSSWTEWSGTLERGVCGNRFLQVPWLSMYGALC
jgi:hypothetical protein